MRPNESFVSQPVRSLQTMLRVLAEDDRTLPTVIPLPRGKYNEIKDIYLEHSFKNGRVMA